MAEGEGTGNSNVEATLNKTVFDCLAQKNPLISEQR